MIVSGHYGVNEEKKIGGIYNIITEREVHKMFTQYSKELNGWGIYKLVQKEGKIKAERLAAEHSKEAAIRKMHELYNERG